MTDAASTSLTPLAQSFLRLVPIATTFAISMCHFDQHLVFSSFLPAKAPPHDKPSMVSHVMREYIQGALPLVIALEFASYGCFAANVYYRLPQWKWYGFGLVCSLTHLVNAPYSWKLLTAIKRGDEVTAKKEGKPVKTTAALEEFVRMNKLRLILTELPLMAIVIGAGVL
ncbi:hypothetical protein DL768_008059 [Monosporascus sp. mg162]|nr:hypothetical protein DL768_008059 [Monosporascus sp. mg162]